MSKPHPESGVNGHRCPGVAERLEAAGLVIGGHAEDAGVEPVELPGHPFYRTTLFQPQVGGSRVTAVHPLLAALTDAASGRPT